MILMSDGVAEATDTNGTPFGFERIHDLLRTTTGPTELQRCSELWPGRRHQCYSRDLNSGSRGCAGMSGPERGNCFSFVSVNGVLVVN
jgi:hypothetical protein